MKKSKMCFLNAMMPCNWFDESAIVAHKRRWRIGLFRALSLLAVVVLTLKTACAYDFDDAGMVIVDGDYWQYYVYDGFAEISTIYNVKDKKKVIVPQTINGYPVSRIGPRLFQGCEKLQEVLLPQGLTQIDGDAFSGCTNLISLTIPSGVTNIGYRAFYQCKRLSELKFPDCLESVRFETCFGCANLRTVSLPKQLSLIERQAFSNCRGLTSIEIPDGVKEIEMHAFEYCKSLTRVRIPESIESLGQGVFADCTSLESVEFLPKLDGIPSYMFSGCSSLKEFSIPEGVQTIGAGAFGGCAKLVDVHFPDGIVQIGKDAYHGCISLSAVAIPSSVVDVGETAFYGCWGLLSVEVNISNAATNFGFGVFFDCRGVRTAKILSRAKVLSKTGIGVFNNPIPDVTVADSAYVSFLGKKSIERIVFTGDMDKINDELMKGFSNLRQVVIENGVSQIGAHSFENCTGLESISIPGSMTSIGGNAFSGCTGLKIVYVDKGEEEKVKVLLQNSGFDMAGVKIVLLGGDEQGEVNHSVCFYATPKSWMAKELAIDERKVENGIPLGSLPSASMVGYTLDGWWVIAEDWEGGSWSDAYKSQVDADTIVTRDMVICGKWIANMYYISFNANGGSVSPDQMGVTYEDVIPDLPTPDLAGHLFRGWYAADGKRFPSEVLKGDAEEGYCYSIPSNLTVWASWEVVETPPPQYGPWGEAEAVKNPDKLGPTMLTDMTLELNGAAGAVGDVVAAFRGDTGALCGLGKVMDESGTLTMACYAPTGVKLHFKVWVAASGVEEPVVVDCNAKSDLAAPTSGAFFSGHALVVSDDKDLTISLGSADWHTVSFNVLPEDPSPAAVFGSVKAKIAAVTQGIEFWMPSKSSSLKTIEIGKGYWVNTKVDDVEWTVSGKTDPKVEIALEEGWNLVGYAPETEGAVQAVLKTALAAKAVDYVTYGVEFYPGGILKKMEPGKAYWVHATKAWRLVYDEPVESSRFKVQSAARLTGAAPVPTYGPWGESEAVKNPDKLGPTFLTDVAVEIDGAPAEYGDVVAVFRGDTGALCGLGKVMDDSGTLTVVCYAPKGVTLSFKVWLAESGVGESVVVKCDNASRLVAPDVGAFYAGHEISGSTVDECTVTFDATGGTAGWAHVEVAKGAAVGALPAATWEGHEFLGWFTAAVGGTQVTAATVVTADVTFYAQWREIGGGGEGGGGGSGGGVGEEQQSPAPAVEIAEPVQAFVAPTQKAVMSGAVLAADGSVAGVVQLNLGKASKTGTSKVSVTIIGLDGKKKTSKAVEVQSGTGLQRVSFDVKGYGVVTLDIGADGFVSQGNGTGDTIAAVKAETVLGEAMATFVPADDFELDNMLAEYLPTDIVVTRAEKKWTVPKAGKLKYVKPNEKKGVAGGLTATDENVSGLKLTYNAKAGTLKGSFKIWTFDEAKGKLKSVSATVTGVVINGVGYCEVTVKKQKIGAFIVE